MCASILSMCMCPLPVCAPPLCACIPCVCPRPHCVPAFPACACGPTVCLHSLRVFVAPLGCLRSLRVPAAPLCAYCPTVCRLLLAAPAIHDEQERHRLQRPPHAHCGEHCGAAGGPQQLHSRAHSAWGQGQGPQELAQPRQRHPTREVCVTGKACRSSAQDMACLLVRVCSRAYVPRTFKAMFCGQSSGPFWWRLQALA